MRVTSKKFVREIAVNNNDKKLEITLNYPPDSTHLMINHLIISTDKNESENLLNKNLPFFAHKGRESSFHFNGKYLSGSVVKLRVRNPQNGDYEDRIFEVDSFGKCTEIVRGNICEE